MFYKCELFKGTEEDVRLNNTQYSYKLVEGPIEERTDAIETLNAYNYEKDITLPVYWILYNKTLNYYTIFYGNKHHLDIKTKNKSFIILSSPLTYKKAKSELINYKSNKILETTDSICWWIVQKIEGVAANSYDQIYLKCHEENLKLI